jgi:hypothetical protein
MLDNQSGLVLKRPVTLTVIVTPRWKEEMQQQLQVQVDQLDIQLQQLDLKGKQAMIELQKQLPTVANPQSNAQMQNLQGQINQERNKILQKKSQFLQQMQQAQLAELNTEIQQTQLESFFRVEKGDNLVNKMNIEIVMRDGIVEDIRGDV